MRTGLKLTKREQNQIERSLQKLDAGYAAGKVPERLYKYQRGQLLANLQRPKAAITPIAANQKKFYQNRRDMQFGPAPVGYWEKDPIVNPPANRMVNQSKVRSSLLSIHDNAWWNDGFQESLRESAKARNVEEKDESEFINQTLNFEKTLQQANALAGTISANTFSNTDVWNEIQNSQTVIRALQLLANNIENTVNRMMRAGLPEKYARDAIRSAAIKAGKAMTNNGYSPERAAEITAMVVRGELSVKGAINVVAEDINNTNQAVAAMNSNSASSPQAMWRNDFNIHATGPSGGGVSLNQLIQMKNDLTNELSTENNPNTRNQIAQALTNLQQQINQREAGIQNIQTGINAGPQGRPVTNTQGNGYNPTMNLLANQSTMEDTVAALSKGGPDLWRMVNDIVTIDGNMYFDYMMGESIGISIEGNPYSATGNSNEGSIYPSGEFTIYSSGRASIPNLRIIISQIKNALNSPFISNNDKGYLRYLEGMINNRIETLQSQIDPSNLIVNNTANNGALLPNLSNNLSNLPNNSYNMPNNAQQQAQNAASNNAVNANNGVNNVNNNASNRPANPVGIPTPIPNYSNIMNGLPNPPPSGLNNANNGVNNANNGVNNANNRPANPTPNPLPTVPEQQNRKMTINNLVPPHITNGHVPLSKVSTQELNNILVNLSNMFDSGMIPEELQQLALNWMQKISAELTSRKTTSASQVKQNQKQSNQQREENYQGMVNISVPGGFKPITPPSRISTLSRSLRGSTSTTSSSRSHGGARFVNGNDPRMAHRTW